MRIEEHAIDLLIDRGTSLAAAEDRDVLERDVGKVLRSRKHAPRICLANCMAGPIYCTRHVVEARHDYPARDVNVRKERHGEVRAGARLAVERLLERIVLRVADLADAGCCRCRNHRNNKRGDRFGANGDASR